MQLISPKKVRIAGSDLLALAQQIIETLRFAAGGVLEFLECEDNPFLLDFYTKNGFKPFDTRRTATNNGTQHLLHQLLKFI